MVSRHDLFGRRKATTSRGLRGQAVDGACHTLGVDEVRIERVDERDSCWDDPGPRFRVYLHGSGPDATMGWTDPYNDGIESR